MQLVSLEQLSPRPIFTETETRRTIDTISRHAWPPTVTRTLLTCSSAYCAYVAWLHDRDMAQMRRRLTDWQGAAQATSAKLAPAVRAGAEASAAAHASVQAEDPPLATVAWHAQWSKLLLASVYFSSQSYLAALVYPKNCLM